MRVRTPSGTEKGGRRPGERTLNDLAQLTKAMIKPMEVPKSEPPPAPVEGAAGDRDAEEVLAYFSRPPRMRQEARVLRPRRSQTRIGLPLLKLRWRPRTPL